jgi:hypothetical protein
MAYEASGSENKNSNLAKGGPSWPVAVLIALVALVVGGVAGGLIVNGGDKEAETAEVKGATAVVGDFVAEINKRDYQAAYNYLGDKIQSGTSREALQEIDFPADLYANCVLVDTGEADEDDMKVVTGELNCDSANYDIKIKVKDSKFEYYSVARK